MAVHSHRLSARDRLLAAADELFYSEGVHVVGVDRIVEQAGVTKASLYNTFGSKDELVRAYLEQHMRRRQERIARILAANDTPRKQILGVFAEVEDLLAGSQFRGCRFISAAAEARPGDASELMAAQYRAWLWSLFTDLAKAAGARRQTTRETAAVDLRRRSGRRANGPGPRCRGWGDAFRGGGAAGRWDSGTGGQSGLVTAGMSR